MNNYSASAPASHEPAVGIVLRFEDGTTLPIDFQTATADLWPDVSAQCAERDGDIMVELINVSSWSRYAAIQLLRQLQNRSTIRSAGQTYPDAFAAILATMVGTGNLNAHQATYRAAIESAAVFHGGVADAAAGRIVQRLGELGAAGASRRSIAKQIRLIAGEDGGGSDEPDAREVAQAYLAYLREEHDLADDEPALWFFRSYFHMWAGDRWSRVDDDRFRAEVISFLQSLPQLNVTRKFVGDVVANLEGLALLNRWALNPPFFVSSLDPIQITYPPLLVFGNGVISLNELV
ncbi:MAG: hypothetical protein WD294_17015 [Phycisphaeraceae bacterium]